ncbi:MAG: glycosyltransferase [Dehalococcoidales bacterium]
MTNNERRKRALIISFVFPPANTIGAVRIGKFAKYLPQFGWEPIILAADSTDRWPQTVPVEVDEAWIYRTPVNRTVHGLLGMVLRAILLTGLLDLIPVINRLVVGAVYYWYWPAVRKGLEVIRKNDINLIFSTYDPIACHLIARYFQKEAGIPWVAEFRDLWSLSHYDKTREPIRFFQKQREKRTMKNSALLITVSKPLAKKLEKLHSKKVVIIPNGFDEEDYKENIPLLPRFTISYTGNIFPGKEDPSPLFQALAELRDEGRLLPDDLEVRFFGRMLKTISPLIERYKVEQFVRVYGLVPFRQSIIKQKESTVLLLLSWNDPREKGVYTAKIFEYLGAARPILTIGLKGSVIDELLASTGSGIIATEVEEIKHLLVKWFEEFSQSGDISFYYHPNKDAIKRYSRREQARELAEVFDSIFKQKKPTAP